MPRDQKKRRLGRGLSSLIRPSAELDQPGEYAPVSADAGVSPSGHDRAAQGTPTQTVAVRSVRFNPQQPRRSFDEDALAELAQSIRTHGILQPVLVRALAAPEGELRYELIAGERRLRACLLAGVAEVPCVVRPSSQREMLELALVENIHRADLNPMDRARAYQDLMDRFGLTQQEVAERIGQPRATVANYLRLQELCDVVQGLLAAGKLSFGHGKVLAGLVGREGPQVKLARRVVRDGLSVRKLETLVERERVGGAQNQGQTPSTRAPYLVEVERQLAEAVGAKVAVRPGRGKHSGRIVIEYQSLEDFDRVLAALGVNIDS